MLYEYLLETYGENEPIFISKIEYKGMTRNNIRQQFARLVSTGRLRRYDKGIYFIPGQSIFKSGSQLSRDKVIQKKYLFDDGQRCGYIGGLLFANQLGLTGQLPAACEIVTNKATNNRRKVRLASSELILRKPYIKVNDDNFRALQLLDLLKDIDIYSEKDKDEQSRRVLEYMTACGMMPADLTPYLPDYPDRTYKNIYEMGLLKSVSS